MTTTSYQKWLVTMATKSPKEGCFPSKWPKFMAYKYGGDPKPLATWGWSSQQDCHDKLCESARLQLVERRVVVARSGVGARGGSGWTRIFLPVFFLRKINKHKKKQRNLGIWIQTFFSHNYGEFFFCFGRLQFQIIFWMFRIDMNGFPGPILRTSALLVSSRDLSKGGERWPTQHLRGSSLVTVIELFVWYGGLYYPVIYIYITSRHYKDPYSTTRIQWNVIRVFFVAQIESPDVGGGGGGCFLECLVAEAGWKFLYSLY